MTVQFIKSISDILLFLGTTLTGWLILGSLFVLILGIALASALYKARLLARSAGIKLGVWGSLLTVFETLGKLGTLIIENLPVLVLILLGALSMISIGETIKKVDAALMAGERIRELQAVLRNLDRSIKVAELRVNSTAGGYISFDITFFAGTTASSALAKAAETRSFTIKGKELYIDSLVLNFDYSEIAAGRRVNIAIPYRVFSDEVPQIEGISLGGMDRQGIPYMFYRSDEDIYGIAPAVYRQRLAELVQLVQSDERARQAGIVRSLYGSALHKRVSPGDRLEIRSEQTGGLTLQEKLRF